MAISRRSLLLASIARIWPQQPTFSTGVDLVTVLATVKDRRGIVVKNLNRDDFLLAEDGQPQTIRYFSRETDLPLTVGLLVDTSRSQEDVIEAERRASFKFLDQVLRENIDVAFIAHFDIHVEVVQGFTSSRKDLATALDRLTVPSAIATRLYDAVRECSENQMRPRKGRKAFVLLSDGVNFRSKNSIVTAIEFAQRADTAIYSVLFEGPMKAYLPFRTGLQAALRKRGRGAMRRLALETGGAFFEVTRDQPIDSIFAQIEDTLRSQYSIGYTPAQSGAPGTYHKIKLTTKTPGLIVQARYGYYSK